MTAEHDEATPGRSALRYIHELLRFLTVRDVTDDRGGPLDGNYPDLLSRQTYGGVRRRARRPGLTAKLDSSVVLGDGLQHQRRSGRPEPPAPIRRGPPAPGSDAGRWDGPPGAARPATTTAAITCTGTEPNAAATAPATAPPASITKTKSTLITSIAPRTRASPSHAGHELSLNHDMPFPSSAQLILPYCLLLLGTADYCYQVIC